MRRSWHSSRLPPLRAPLVVRVPRLPRELLQGSLALPLARAQLPLEAMMTFLKRKRSKRLLSTSLRR
jgi:hypothetical protein